MGVADAVGGHVDGTSLRLNLAEHAGMSPEHWWIVGRQRIFAGVLARWLPAGARVLDVGCGVGLLSQALGRRYDLDSVDISAPAVAIARSRGVNARLVGPLEAFGGPYDSAVAFDVMEHVADDLGFARRLAASVEPGSIAVVTVPAYQFLWSPMDAFIGHRRRYRRRTVYELMQAAGFATLHLTYFNTLLFPAIALMRALHVGNGGGDVAQPPAAMNAILRGVFTAERFIVPRGRLPFGVSLLYVGRRRSEQPYTSASRWAA